MDRDVYNSNKYIHHKEALVKISKKEIVSPVNFQVDLTNKCNNKCRWCFWDIHPLPEMSRKDFISKEKMIEVIGDFKEIGGQAIEWTGGGEPTVSPYFIDVVNESRRRGLGQALVTNGKRLAGIIEEAVMDFDWVRVSLNSSSVAMYKKLHGNDSFLRVINNIEKFAVAKAENCVLGVSMIVDEYNWTEIVPMTVIAKEMGANNVRIGVPQTPKNEKLFDGIWDKVVERMELAKTCQDDNFMVFTLSGRIETLAHKTTSKRCYCHHLVPSLGANGVVYPCCHLKYLPEYNLGNVNETSFKEVWNGATRKTFIDTIGENCTKSCWFNDKNKLADYIVKEPLEVPHLAYP